MYPSLRVASLWLLPVALGVLPCLVRAVRVPGDLSGPWQLFVDDSIIAGKRDVIRALPRLREASGEPGSDRRYAVGGWKRLSLRNRLAGR